MKPRVLLKWLVVALATGFGLALASASPSPLPAGDPVLGDLTLRLAQSQDEAAPPAESGTADGPLRVTVGFYPITVYDLDIGSSTFNAAAYVWFRWRGDVDPTDTVEFVNAVEDWGLTKQIILPEPRQSADGTFYQIMRVQGRFFQGYSLSQFPLDSQTLTITVEDSAYTADRVVYVADTMDSGIGARLRVPGWNIASAIADAGTYTYDTGFGEGGPERSVYSTASFTLTLHRPVTFFILKFLLPLCIVLMANWTALLMQPRLIETRTALPTTALLTVMFLQQSQSIGRLVLLDKIYAVAYAMIILTLVTVILTSRGIKAGTETAHPIRERVILLIQALVFAFATGILVATR